MQWREFLLWFGLVVCTGLAVLRSMDCQMRLDTQQHQRQMECIRQHIYCGERRVR